MHSTRCCRGRVGRGAGRGSGPATSKICPCDQKPKCSQAVLCPPEVCPASAPCPASARVATSFAKLRNTTAGSRLANPSCGVDGSAREPRLRKWARPQPSQPRQGVVRRAGQVLVHDGTGFVHEAEHYDGRWLMHVAAPYNLEAGCAVAFWLDEELMAIVDGWDDPKPEIQIHQRRSYIFLRKHSVLIEKLDWLPLFPPDRLDADEVVWRHERRLSDKAIKILRSRREWRGCLVVDVKMAMGRFEDGVVVSGSAASPAGQTKDVRLRQVFLHAPSGRKAVTLANGKVADHSTKEIAMC